MAHKGTGARPGLSPVRVLPRPVTPAGIVNAGLFPESRAGSGKADSGDIWGSTGKGASPVRSSESTGGEGTSSGCAAHWTEAWVWSSPRGLSFLRVALQYSIPVRVPVCLAMMSAGGWVQMLGVRQSLANSSCILGSEDSGKPGWESYLGKCGESPVAGAFTPVLDSLRLEWAVWARPWEALDSHPTCFPAQRRSLAFGKFLLG